ncbi:MAG: ribosome maturation factor RimM [Acholeplasmatales bacterium]|nr:ribosome maturation factor RimM [Acholeplasmatales bacterium]
MKFYKCGHIMTTHGIRGALKIKNLSDFDRFFKGSRLYILYNDDYVMVKVKSVSTQDAHLLVTFENLEDINLVEKYRNTDIYVSELDRANELSENEYYFSDLIGKEVENQNGEARGIVKEVREYPVCHYLVVRYNDKDSLIPFQERFVKDVTDTKIIINEIEGLF